MPYKYVDLRRKHNRRPSLCPWPALRLQIPIYRRHIPNLTQKNGMFCKREHPNIFIQRSSLNIMYMLRHKMLGCSSVYDEDFLRRDESGGLWGGNGQNLDESGGFGEKMDEWTKFGFFCRAILNAGIYSCERY